MRWLILGRKIYYQTHLPNNNLKDVLNADDGIKVLLEVLVLIVREE